METVQLTIDYESQEPGGITSTRFLLKKVLIIEKLPPYSECCILLENDAISNFHFRNPIYDPKTDTYYITNKSSEGVERYYHGNCAEIMKKVIDRYRKYNWIVEKME